MEKAMQKPSVESVKLRNGFFFDVQKKIMEQVIPYQWKALNDEIPGAEKSHCLENFRLAAGEAEGEFYGRVFQDSDLAKWMEAASYELIVRPDAALEKKLEDCVDLIRRAQRADGYVDTFFIVKEPQKRWTDLMCCHEMYCMGHMMEAAVAYHQATGKADFMEIMERAFDQMTGVIGPEEGKFHGYPGHPELELALMRMYGETGKEKFLHYADYLIRQRGQKPNYFEEEAKRNTMSSPYYPLMVTWGHEYSQCHLPIAEQTEAVGHAVRALYLYSGALDTAVATDNIPVLKALEGLWRNVVDRRMYITGGIGSTHVAESFTTDYDLPNDSAYTETCAAIALGLFASRMLYLTGKGEYADILEKVLYNGAISGMSLDGTSFFYVNPLEEDPKRGPKNPDIRHALTHRQKWFGCACCPPNVARFYMSVGQHVFGWKEKTLSVNLFADCEAKLGETEVQMETDYPRRGDVRLNLSGKAPVTVRLHIPAWCTNWSVSVDGKKAEAELADGYATLKTPVARGEIRLSLDMKPFRVWANSAVKSDAGKVAVQRGPVVYCLEEADNGPQLHNLLLSRGEISEKFEGWPEGFPVLYVQGLREYGRDGALYAEVPPEVKKQELKFVPYYAWCNRGEGEMTVWVRDAH